MELVCKHYYCGYFMVILYFSLYFYTYSLTLHCKEELCHLPHLINYFYQYGLMDIYYVYGLNSNAVVIYLAEQIVPALTHVLTFWCHKTFQVHLTCYLSRPWNQRFLQGSDSCLT